MQSTNAEKDYGRAIEYLDGSDGDKADPEERPAARYVHICYVLRLTLQYCSHNRYVHKKH